MDKKNIVKKFMKDMEQRHGSLTVEYQEKYLQVL